MPADIMDRRKLGPITELWRLEIFKFPKNWVKFIKLRRLQLSIGRLHIFKLEEDTYNNNERLEQIVNKIFKSWNINSENWKDIIK